VSALVDDLLRQPSLDAASQLLRSRPDEIDDELLRTLGGIAQRERDEGRLPEAATVFAHARVAAGLGGEAVREAQFAALLAEILDELGHEQAEQNLEFALELADERLAAGDRSFLTAFMGMTLRLADRAEARDEPEVARRILGYARRRARALGSLLGELWAAFRLLLLAVRLHDLRPARGYASLLARTLGEAPSEEGLDPPAGEDVYQLLIQTADLFYYEEEDFEAAAEIARDAVDLAPDDGLAHRALGNALVQLERWEEACTAWEAALARPPVPASTCLNYASTLLQLDRKEDALAAVDQAIALAPAEPRYRLVRGQVNQQLGRHEDAVVDFDDLIELARKAPDEELGKKAASAAEYMREISAQDLADFARIFRVKSLQALGRADDALAGARALVAEGDEPTRLSGRRLVADIHDAAGRHEEALEELDAAVDEAPNDHTTRLRHADTLLALGRHEDALPDLVFAAERNRSPDEALERLEGLATKRPDDPHVLKALGYAYHEAWRPSRAVEKLSEAIEALPDDPDPRYWRGLARITMSPLPEEHEWNEAFSFGRLFAALEDLATAVRLTPEGGEPLAAYIWLVDRVSADHRVLTWLEATAEEPAGLFTLVPSVREPLEKFYASFDRALGPEQQWEASVENLRAAQAGLAQAGFPVFASRLHLHLADTLVRLYELQLALDHVAQARRSLELHGRPLTDHLRPEAEAIADRTWEASARQAAALEVEYALVYQVGYLGFMKLVDMVEAQILARIGDYERAVAVIGDVEEYRNYATLGWSEPSAFHALEVIATVLRDAGAPEKALELLEPLRELAVAPREHATVHNLAGTLYMHLGRWEEARDCFRTVSEVVEAAGIRTPGLEINLASTAAQMGAFEEALGALDEVDPADLRTDRDRLLFHTLKAHVLEGLDRFLEAKVDAEAALELVEGERSDLRLLDLRMSLQGRQESLYELVVRIFLVTGDWPRAFDVVEQSRSRAFIDQLAAGRLPLPPEAEGLQRVEANLLTKQELLLRLAESLAAYGPDFVDYELVDRLEDVDDRLALFEEEDGRERTLSAAKIGERVTETERALADVRRQIEAAQRRHLDVASGEVLDLPEIRALLGS
jgi:tetratricopeptide (TPR) repeat protein